VTAALLDALARCAAVAPESARSALAAATRYLAGGGDLGALRDAASALRAAYELEAPPCVGHIRAARHAHGDRYRTPWADPCDDPRELRPLADCVAAVYAVEAHATGGRAAVVGYYLCAIGAWS